MAQILKSLLSRPGKSATAASGPQGETLSPQGETSGAPDDPPQVLRADPATNAARDVTGLAGFNLEDLAETAREQLRLAREATRQFLEDAKVEAERLKAEAKRQGHTEGIQQGQRDIEKRIATESAKQSKAAVEQLRKTISEVRSHHDQWLQRYAETLTDTIVAATERVVVDKLTREPAIIAKWVTEAIASTRAADQLVIAVHPETLAELAEPLEEILSGSEIPEGTSLFPDESVSPSSVEVRQPGGKIEAGLHAQLDLLSTWLGGGQSEASEEEPESADRDDASSVTDAGES